jgi:hypothetical protein
VREPAHDVASGFGLYVDRDTTLAAIARRVQRAHAVHRHPDPPPDVADTGSLHLDHLGALVGEERAGERSGRGDRQVEDADPGERSRAGHQVSHAARGPAASVNNSVAAANETGTASSVTPGFASAARNCSR